MTPNGKVLGCPDCSKSWTHEDMVCTFLKSKGVEDEIDPSINVDDVKAKDRVPRARMLASIVEFQKSGTTENTPSSIINAACQCHLSCHINKSCFKCQNPGSKKRGHICGPKCECRFRLPDRARPTTTIDTTEIVDWYSWNGDIIDNAARST